MTTPPYFEEDGGPQVTGRADRWRPEWAQPGVRPVGGVGPERGPACLRQESESRGCQSAGALQGWSCRVQGRERGAAPRRRSGGGREASVTGLVGRGFSADTASPSTRSSVARKGSSVSSRAQRGRCHSESLGTNTQVAAGPLGPSVSTRTSVRRHDGGSLRWPTPVLTAGCPTAGVWVPGEPARPCDQPSRQAGSTPSPHGSGRSPRDILGPRGSGRMKPPELG